MSKILDGKILAQEIKESLKKEVLSLQKETDKVPRMVNILIGDDHGTCAYANSQKKVANAIGIDYDLIELPESISQEDLVAKLKVLNEDEGVNGIMIHRPVPQQIDYKEAANCVSTSKDLEGINVENIGKMIIGDTKIIPCTPASVMAHLKSTGVDLRGKEAVIIGHSVTVGKPLSILLLGEMATVTVCHIATSEAGQLSDHIKRADILVVAVGSAGLVKGESLKDGAIVVDVGINRVDGKIVGDVDFETAKDKTSFITPVPGGVGPVTVVMLMKNSIEAFKKQNSIV
jgi:methylenetetrahydrofolate dehydrogenase (NADP+)/methenyltetrahydrofolate cyclohydrolase